MSEHNTQVPTVSTAFEKFLGKFFKFIILFVGGMFLTTIVDGFATMKLWEWFMVPTFGLRALSLVQAIGVSMVIAIFTLKAPQKSEKKLSNADCWYRFGSLLFGSLFLLLCGWIVTWFM